jgi:hypothetical protein
VGESRRATNQLQSKYVDTGEQLTPVTYKRQGLALQIGHNTAPSKNLSSRDPASRATSPSNSEKKCFISRRGHTFRAGAFRKHQTRVAELSKRKCLSCRPLRLNREPGILPGLESALKGVDVVVAELLKLLRQTGARMFFGSCAIGNHGPGFCNSREILIERIERDSDRLRYHGVGLRPRLRISDVDNRKLLSRVHSFLEFFNLDSRRFAHV